MIFFIDENILYIGNNLFLSNGSEPLQHSWVSETITVISGEKRIGQNVTVSAYLYKKICGRGVPPHNYGGVQLHLLNFGKLS